MPGKSADIVLFVLGGLLFIAAVLSTLSGEGKGDIVERQVGHIIVEYEGAR